MRSIRVIPLVLLMALTACASTPESPDNAGAAAATVVEPRPELPSTYDKAVTRNRVILAGQPNPADLARWRDQGVATIVNLRTPGEMADLSAAEFDEALVAQELGFDYSLQPIGGAAHPFRPEVLDAFVSVLENSSGPVLLHCASGGRAALLYAAYEIKHLGRSPDEAMRALEEFGAWPLPIERLTGIPLKVERR